MSRVLITCIFLLISILLIYSISTCSLLIVWKSIFESKMQFYFLRCCSKSKISFEMVISKKGKLFNKNFFLPTNWTKSFILLLLGSLYNTRTFDIMRVSMSLVTNNWPVYSWQIKGNLLHFSGSSKIWRCLII
jgi:hypothetical protein